MAIFIFWTCDLMNMNLYVHVDKISNHVKKKKDVKTLTVAFSFDYLASV